MIAVKTGNVAVKTGSANAPPHMARYQGDAGGCGFVPVPPQDTTGDGFTLVPHRYLLDERLTPQALGLLVEIASYGPGHAVTIADLVTTGPETASELEKSVHELAQYGYLRARKNVKSNHWSIPKRHFNFPAIDRYAQAVAHND